MTDDVTQVSAPRPGPNELRPGDVLRGRFVIERLLGEGGMGKVFLAVDREAEQTNPFVALKMLGDSFREHPQSLKALRREATQSRGLNHPNIVSVYDFDRTEGHVFMVMEYMQGRSLEAALADYPNGRKLIEVWHIIEACGLALQYLHEKQIVHSDFKPGNVFLTDKGEIKVLDLGIARTIDETQLAIGTTRFDPDALHAMTPRYASCEMFEGLTPTPQDDLYAFGCVIYELLTGAHPYANRHAIEARADRMAPKRPRGLKPRQWKALSGALAFSRAGRHPSVWHFLQDLTPVRKKSSPVPWIAATVGVVAAAAVLTFTQLRSADDRFREALLEQFAEAPASPVAVAQAQDWVAQGNFFLEQGRRAMTLGEYDRAASVLLVSPSSAFKSFELALRRSDVDDIKLQAADGMLRISQAFRDAASSMLERGEAPEIAARTVCLGLQVNRFEPELEAQLRSLDRRIARGVGSVSACRELINSGTVSL